MNRKILTSTLAACALLIGVAFAVAQQFGTAVEAKAMLEKAVAANELTMPAALRSAKRRNLMEGAPVKKTGT